MVSHIIYRLHLIIYANRWLLFSYLSLRTLFGTEGECVFSKHFLVVAPAAATRPAATSPSTMRAACAGHPQTRSPRRRTTRTRSSCSPWISTPRPPDGPRMRRLQRLPVPAVRVRRGCRMPVRRSAQPARRRVVLLPLRAVQLGSPRLVRCRCRCRGGGGGQESAGARGAAVNSNAEETPSHPHAFVMRNETRLA